MHFKKLMYTIQFQNNTTSTAYVHNTRSAHAPLVLHDDEATIQNERAPILPVYNATMIFSPIPPPPSSLLAGDACRDLGDGADADGRGAGVRHPPPAPSSPAPPAPGEEAEAPRAWRGPGVAAATTLRARRGRSPREPGAARAGGRWGAMQRVPPRLLSHRHRPAGVGAEGGRGGCGGGRPRQGHELDAARAKECGGRQKRRRKLVRQGRAGEGGASIPPAGWGAGGRRRGAGMLGGWAAAAAVAGVCGRRGGSRKARAKSRLHPPAPTAATPTASPPPPQARGPPPMSPCPPPLHPTGGSLLGIRMPHPPAPPRSPSLPSRHRRRRRIPDARLLGDAGLCARPRACGFGCQTIPLGSTCLRFPTAWDTS